MHLYTTHISVKILTRQNFNSTIFVSVKIRDPLLQNNLESQQILCRKAGHANKNCDRTKMNCRADMRYVRA